MIFHFDPDRKYKISKDEISKLKYSGHQPQSILSNKEELIKTRFKTYLQAILHPANGIINGDKLKNIIFPTQGYGQEWNFDIFISHSHNDLSSAQKLASFLRNDLRMKPFIDSYIWGSADELLKEIDKDYCAHSNGKSFDYNKRNFSTSHVHTMLSMAILEIIARCKAFVFIESDESLDYNQLKDYNLKTISPWLYQELQYANMLSIAVFHQLNEERSFSEGGRLTISYEADLSNFKSLTAKQLQEMASNKDTL